MSQDMHQNQMNKQQYKQQEEHDFHAQQKTGDFNFSFKPNDEVEVELRKPRSQTYLEMFAAIDMLSATDEEIIAKLKETIDEDTAEEFSEMSEEELLEEIKQSFLEEFEKIPIERKPMGVISKCYIAGCDCHAIDSSGNILQHFNADMPLPDDLAIGRVAYHKHPDCRCIEVYSFDCKVIMPDGSVFSFIGDE